MFKSTFCNILEEIKELSICECPQALGQVKYAYCYQLNYCKGIITQIKAGNSCYFLWAGDRPILNGVILMRIYIHG